MKVADVAIHQIRKWRYISKFNHQKSSYYCIKTLKTENDFIFKDKNI